MIHIAHVLLAILAIATLTVGGGALLAFVDILELRRLELLEEAAK